MLPDTLDDIAAADIIATLRRHSAATLLRYIDVDMFCLAFQMFRAARWRCCCRSQRAYMRAPERALLLIDATPMPMSPLMAPWSRHAAIASVRCVNAYATEYRLSSIIPALALYDIDTLPDAAIDVAAMTPFCRRHFYY